MAMHPRENVALSLRGLFTKHEINYTYKKTKYSHYFSVCIGENELLIRVSDHDQPICMNKPIPDFDLRIKKDYNNIKKIIKGLKYNGKTEC